LQANTVLNALQAYIVPLVVICVCYRSVSRFLHERFGDVPRPSPFAPFDLSGGASRRNVSKAPLI